MCDIITLWNSNHIPIRDGLYCPNGTIFDISIKYNPSPHLTRGEPFITDKNDVDFSKLASIGEIFRLEFSNGGVIVLGEGGYGSEGFFAHLDSKNELQWVFYSETCNPFISAVEDENGHVINHR
jgi:hypothetical protein